MTSSGEEVRENHSWLDNSWRGYGPQTDCIQRIGRFPMATLVCSMKYRYMILSGLTNASVVTMSLGLRSYYKPRLGQLSFLSPPSQENIIHFGPACLDLTTYTLVIEFSIDRMHVPLQAVNDILLDNSRPAILNDTLA